MEMKEKNGKWLYLECYSGISGDMTVGALLDLGARKEVLERALSSLGVDGYHLHFGRTVKCGIDAYDFDVHLEEGCNHEHKHPHSYEHSREDAHKHGHSHQGASGEGHAHRNIKDIFHIINRLEAEEPVKEMARKMFSIVAEAESKAHGIPVEEVHFHEVGAIDSIVDIISVAVCLYDLGIERVAVSRLAEGRGYVRCQHGIMPVPVPATANIAAAWGLQLMLTDNEGEMVTPTGAAIAAALKTEDQLPKHYTIEKIGIGAGRKDFKNANILRAMLINPVEKKAESNDAPDSLWELETNIDDSTGEALGFVMELLLEEGAKDVWYTPALMKKNRPAYVLHTLCEAGKIEEMEAIIFAHTTTIGIRRYPVERTTLLRRVEEIETRFGIARVKCCQYKDKQYNYPEYDSVREICRLQKLEFSEVYHAVKEAANANRKTTGGSDGKSGRG